MPEIGSERFGGKLPFGAMIALACLFVLPNFLIWSTDDIAKYNNSVLNSTVAINQAGEGRFTFSLVVFVLNKLRFDYTSFLCLSFLIFCLSLAAIFYEVCQATGTIDRKAQLVGYGIFLTFGLSLDLYQFTFAYISYGISILCVAGALRCVASPLHPPVRAGMCTALIFAGFGSYQAIGQMMLMVVVLLVVVPGLTAASPGAPGRLWQAAAILVAGTVAGGVLYFAANVAMKHLLVPGFEGYPARPQGLSFVQGNIHNYLRSLRDLLSLKDNLYAPLLPSLWKLGFFVVLVTTVSILVRSNPKRWPLPLAAVALAVAAWPNPTNMLLRDYWPSARSMVGFGLFLGLVCAALIARAEAVSLGKRGRSPIRTTIYALLVVQCAVAGLRYRDRTIQQVADITTAEAILARTYEVAQGTDPIQLHLGLPEAAYSVERRTVLDFGRSLFDASWSAPALLEYLSGRRVKVSTASPEDCAGSGHSLSVKPQDDHVVACLGGAL